VVDGEESTILGREKAMELWKELGLHPDNAKQFLIYLPIKQPVKSFFILAWHLFSFLKS
jgi:hypothetical protein